MRQYFIRKMSLFGPNAPQVHCISSSESEDDIPSVKNAPIASNIASKAVICELSSSDDEFPTLPLWLRIGGGKSIPEKAANSNEKSANSIEISSEESNQKDFQDDCSLPDIMDVDEDERYSQNSNINFTFPEQIATVSGIVPQTSTAIYKTSDKLDKKAEKQKEKDLKAARVEAVRATKPAECIKLITAAIDPAFLEERETSSTLESIREISATVEIKSQKIPRSLTWRRKLVQLPDNNDSLPEEIEENQVLVIVPSKTFLQLVQGSHQARHGCVAATIEDYVTEVQMSHPGKAVIILVPGLEKYFSQMRSNAQRAFRREALGSLDAGSRPQKRARDNLEGLTVSQIEIEEVLVDLQLRKRNCNVVRVETAADVAAYVASLTKAIANAPYKQNSPAVQSLTWYAEGDSKGTVKVTPDGKGLTELWVKQIQQFALVSVDTASAIVEKFPCPKGLLDAYKQCRSIQEAQMLLSGINVRRGSGPLATTRKVGPQLSRKIHMFFTSDNENAVFDQT